LPGLLKRQKKEETLLSPIGRGDVPSEKEKVGPIQRKAGAKRRERGKKTLVEHSWGKKRKIVVYSSDRGKDEKKVRGSLRKKISCPLVRERGGGSSSEVGRRDRKGHSLVQSRWGGKTLKKKKKKKKKPTPKKTTVPACRGGKKGGGKGKRKGKETAPQVAMGGKKRAHCFDWRMS